MFEGFEGFMLSGGAFQDGVEESVLCNTTGEDPPDGDDVNGVSNFDLRFSLMP